MQRGKDRIASFPEVEEQLNDLLERFGCPGRPPEAYLPFWHLQSDRLWEVQNSASLDRRTGKDRPTVTSMRSVPAQGGLEEHVFDLLRGDPRLVDRVVKTLLEQHFPESLHAEILEAVGLETGDAGMIVAKPRDPGFREQVLMAYEQRCAMCGLKLELAARAIGLDAAHVWWHSHGGSCTVENGLALCPLHHKLLDRGAIGLAEDLTVLISARLTDSSEQDSGTIALHGRRVRAPQRGFAPIARQNQGWHFRQVFRGPARGRTS